MERSQPRPGATPLQFGILGALRIEVDGEEVPLDSAKQRGVLAALLIEPGAVVSTDRLAEVLWRDDQPEDPAGSIRTHVSRLRAVLAGRGGGERARALLVTRPHGYALAVDPDLIDAGRFERLIGEARAAPSPQAVIDLTGAALALWRGQPLWEFDHELAATEAARLEELHGAALELRADAMLRLGHYQQVVSELEVPVARNPLREALRGQLVVALYRCGRQADALAAYRDLRDALVGELGVEPSAALRQLERAILQQSEDLPWPAPPAAPGVGAGDGEGPYHAGAATTPLPEELTTFIGRQEDQRAVTAALRDRRIVVLTGVGGVGKSRLALRVARRVAEGYADGAVLCDLVTADDPAAVRDVLATALGVIPARQRTPEDGLVEHLRAQRLLLVLDNCEHVVDAVSRLVDRIGRRCPGVDVLATSRRPLGIPGQQVWPVAPLDVGDPEHGPAVELFRDRAASADPSWDAAADPDAVADICRRLDGLPLAIELAAAQVRCMNPADITDRLWDRFDVLSVEASTTSPRHESLHAVLDWSHQLLSEPNRRLFDRLSVFAGGFGLDAAERVCAGDGVPAAEVAKRLADLVDHSLVVVDRSGRHARYRLLESVRAYGEGHLRESGELAELRRRHAEHLTSVAEVAAHRLLGPDEARSVQAIDIELPNFREAHRWACAEGQVELALRLSASLCGYAYQRLQGEVHGWALRALDVPGASADPAYPAALIAAAVGRMQRGELEGARHDGEQVLGTATEAGVVLRAHQLLAEIALYQGRLEEADRHGRELAEHAHSVGVAYYEALGHLYRVHAATYRGRAEDAKAYLRDGWQAVGEANAPTLRAGYQYLEGETVLDDDAEVAIAALQQAIETAHSVGNRFVAGVARVAIASLQARHGSPREALGAFREIVDHWRRCGDWVHLWTTMRNLLVLLERVGAAVPAAVLFGAVQTARTGAPAFGADAERLDAAASALRDSLGEQGFAAAEVQGRAMSDEEVVAFALTEIDRSLADVARGPQP